MLVCNNNNNNNGNGMLGVVEVENDITLSLIKTALERGMDIEKIVELREKIKKEIAEQEFFKSFKEFQREIPEIQKDKVVYNKDGSIRYRYASLDTIISTIKPYLSKHGLSLRYETEFTDNNYITLKCIIQHFLGHKEVTIFKLPIDSSQHITDIQKFGSTITYARRYALCLALLMRMMTVM